MADEVKKFLDAEGVEHLAQWLRDQDVGEFTDAEGAEVFNDYVNNKAEGVYSHVEGGGIYKNPGWNDFLEWESLIGSHASGDYSHAEGYVTKAVGTGSHSEGCGGLAQGNHTHTEGYRTFAKNAGAHAEGTGTAALGAYSHSQNISTVAPTIGSTAMGKLNKYQDKDGNNLERALFVGNGNGTTRSNALELDWDGNLLLSGSVTDGNGNILGDFLTTEEINDIINEVVAGTSA